VPDSDDQHEEAGTDAAALGVALRELLDADLTAVVILDLDGAIRAANDTALRLLGASSVEDLVAGTPAQDALASMLGQAPLRLVSAIGDGTWQGDLDHVDALGDHRVLRATLATRRGDGLPGGGYIGLVAHDVTGARAAAAALRHRAGHDALTGLANRRQILTALAHAIADRRRADGRVAAIFVDFDRLKHVNDALGHQIGDRLLVSAARRLSESVRPQDRVARIGGDEFLVVCTGLTAPSDAFDLAERARRALTGRLRLRQLELPLSVSVGVAIGDDDLDLLDPQAAASVLIGNADTAMYEAKTAGRGRSVLFTSAMRSAARERAELAADLAAAIRDRRLRIEYQPLFSTVTHRAVGAEALVRWDHPERGAIEPREFVSIAEEAGSIGELGELVLDQALLETRVWTERGTVDDGFAVHVNVSSTQLASSSFVNLVLARLRSHGLAPGRLVLEAREAALLGRNDDVDRSVRALRRSGVGIAVDNFGTGANSLSVLTEVGADILKLDGAFGLPRGSSEVDTRVARAVVLLAHALGMRVVAQRVDDADQLRLLRAAGCDAVQGDLLAPVAPAADLVARAAFPHDSVP
jgi:diguanylate cyclase (GGDEF)-like protein